MIILLLLKNTCCCYSYATVYTMYPVFSLVLDKDVSAETAMTYPELYKELVKVTFHLKEACYWNMRLEKRYIFLEIQKFQKFNLLSFTDSCLFISVSGEITFL